MENYENISLINFEGIVENSLSNALEKKQIYLDARDAYLEQANNTAASARQGIDQLKARNAEIEKAQERISKKIAHNRIFGAATSQELKDDYEKLELEHKRNDQEIEAIMSFCVEPPEDMLEDVKRAKDAFDQAKTSYLELSSHVTKYLEAEIKRLDNYCSDLVRCRHSNVQLFSDQTMDKLTDLKGKTFREVDESEHVQNQDRIYGSVEIYPMRHDTEPQNSSGPVV